MRVPIANAEKRCRMILDPLNAYSVEADGREETLKGIRKTLLEDLIPRMKHWDKWHQGQVRQ